MRLLLAALAATLVVTGFRQPYPPAAPLNVLVLLADDMRWDAVGAAGNPIVRTPRLDGLAADGIRFEEARVTTSICMVSRATLLTGQHMAAHGITAFGRALSPEAFAASYPGRLREAGYWTGYVGKYGVGQPRPGDFDYLRAYEGTHWMPDGEGGRIHVTERNTRDALEFLRARPGGRPFALTVGFFAAHAEDRAPEQYLPQPWSAALYERVTIPPPLRGDPAYLAALPPFLSSPRNEARVRFGWRFDTPERYQQYMTRYYRLITELDAGIGRIIDELKRLGVYERTLIVFTGDNGYFQADRGLADKWYPYEESIRVPLIVFDPRLEAGRRGATRDAFALNVDVAPTLLAAAGLAASPSMQGQDLSPLYLQPAAPAWRDAFLYDHPTVLGPDRIPSSRAVVTRRWKYIEWPEHDHRQLFDLQSDPGELRNLAGAAPFAAEEAALRQQLGRLRAEAAGAAVGPAAHAR